ncbi:transmembrane protein 192-like [Topomyia yanbarensis]|uniref:transmembrane protein 192-like n=1 Tax=Topomyia yanbarensis TaxID=2498891 RepID=UPI00273B015A|nr:transmembrane protein 192-like [Topomyia yanbarensis]
MSFTNRNLLSFLFFRTTTADSLSGDGRHRAQEEQTLFPTMTDDGKDLSLICFERVLTIWAWWTQIIASAVLTITGLVYTYHECYGKDDECDGYYTMLHLRAVFWLLVYIIHRFVKSRHNRLKVLGYHDFLQETHRYKKAPLKIVSFCNLLLLTLHTILLEVAGSNFFTVCRVEGFSATAVISIFCAVEYVFLVLLHISYSVKIHVFNVVQNPPDALVDSDHPRGGQISMNPEEFVSQQFLLIVKLLDENRHLQDKIREIRSMAHLINSESTHLSLAEQSLIGY